MHHLPSCWHRWHISVYKLCAKLIWAPTHNKIGLKAVPLQLEGGIFSHFLKEGVNQHWQSLFKCHSHHTRAQESPYKAQRCSLSVRFLSNISYNISFRRPCSSVGHDATCFLFFYIYHFSFFLFFLSPLFPLPTLDENFPAATPPGVLQQLCSLMFHLSDSPEVADILRRRRARRC